MGDKIGATEEPKKKTFNQVTQPTTQKQRSKHGPSVNLRTRENKTPDGEVHPSEGGIT